MGHIEPCLAQLTILSIVPRAYSTPFLGVSRLNWFEPTLARSNALDAFSSLMGRAVSVRVVPCETAGGEAGRDEEVAMVRAKIDAGRGAT